MVRRGNICYFNYTLKGGDADFTTIVGEATDTILVGDWDGNCYYFCSDDIYSFYVHDYTNRSSNSSMALSQSDAKVQVYIDGTLANTYYVPLNTEGTVWHVFDYDTSTGRMISVNELYYSSNSATLARNN